MKTESGSEKTTIEWNWYNPIIDSESSTTGKMCYVSFVSEKHAAEHKIKRFITRFISRAHTPFWCQNDQTAYKYAIPVSETTMQTPMFATIFGEQAYDDLNAITALKEPAKIAIDQEITSDTRRIREHEFEITEAGYYAIPSFHDFYTKLIDDDEFITPEQIVTWERFSEALVFSDHKESFDAIQKNILKSAMDASMFGEMDAGVELAQVLLIFAKEFYKTIVDEFNVDYGVEDPCSARGEI